MCGLLLKIGNREFDFLHKTYVAGILNVTPDSFSDGGKYGSIDAALRQTGKMIDEGADIIDIGGESSRPGFDMISAEEETSRVLPVIEAIRNYYEIPLSLDTFHSLTAKEGIAAGIDIINDITGLNPSIYENGCVDVNAYYVKKTCGNDSTCVQNESGTVGEAVKEAGVPCILMSNCKIKEGRTAVDTVLEDLQECVKRALAIGIVSDRIILDPGIGFCKSVNDNLMVLKNLKQFTKLPYPVMLGASRKSVIGSILNTPVRERLEGTLVTTVYAVMAGCSIIRVHDVKENVRAVRMTLAIKDCEEGMERTDG